MIDYRSGTVVAGAVVRFVPSDRGFGAIEGRTDAGGSYSLEVPITGAYAVSVDGTTVGEPVVVTWPAFRGDLLIPGGTCRARYGTVSDAGTMQPITGARVSVSGVSGPDGWYRLDLGCPATPPLPGNTTFLAITHPDYETLLFGEGRGIGGVRRKDAALQRKRPGAR